MKAKSLPSAPRRLVIDTNVIISGALVPAGTTGRLVNQARIHERVVMCELTFHELTTRLNRPKFDRYVSQDMRNIFLQELRAIAQWQHNPVTRQDIVRSRDANDNVFIDLALQSHAHLLISGDKDLLVLTDALNDHGLQVLAPAQALAVLQAA